MWAPDGLWLFFRRRINDFVLGANDGIITTFAIVAGVTGASLNAEVVIVLGAANLLADGVSMGASNYLGRKSERDRDRKPELQGPLEGAIATFLAFVIAGSIPLLAYVVPLAVAWRFPVAVTLTATALFLCGAMRTVVTQRSWAFSGLEMLVIGSVAAAVAYLVGWLLRSVAGTHAG
jgi:vacuolar iron transporter family protein